MTVNPIRFRRRRPAGGAALVCIAALLMGCGPLLPPATGVPNPTTLAPSPTPGGPSQAPAVQLTVALTALRAGYSFDTTLRVGDKDAAHVVGRWYAGANEIAITSGGATVTYRTIPPNAWIQDDTGIWVEADAPAATGDPLAILLVPMSVKAADSGDVGQLVATYPASALGLPGTEPVSVMVSISADGTIITRYEANTDAGLGVSETILKPAPVQDPILAPSAIPAASG